MGSCARAETLPKSPPWLDLSGWLVNHRNAHYVFTVKGNQPSLLTACQQVLSGPVEDFVAEHVAFERGHGRTEQRTRVVAVTTESPITFPHAAQVFRVRRDVGGLDGPTHPQ